MFASNGVTIVLRHNLFFLSCNVICGDRITRNKGLSVRQYYELVADTYDLRSKWEDAVTDAGLDAVRCPVRGKV